MITVSLVKELAFIARYLKTKVVTQLAIGDFEPLTIKIENEIISVEYLNKLIWKESISSSSNFGVESCDTILKIMRKARQGEDWSMYKYIHQ